MANCIPLESGPSTGKTTMIEMLRKRGFNCLDEAATKVIREGLTPDHGILRFQEKVFNTQLQSERAVHGSDGLWFLDRGLLSSAAYLRNGGQPVPPMFLNVDVRHYACVFILEPLETFEQNGIRPAWENLEFSQRLTDLIEAQYSQHNITPVRVPRMSATTPELEIEQRLEFILRHCSKLFASDLLPTNRHP